MKKLQKELYEAPAVAVVELNMRSAIAQTSVKSFPVGGDAGFAILPETPNTELFQW